MVFPLYVTLERMDRTLVEASKDLGAGRWATFRQVTLPIALPGLITGSILVFIPMMGEYVIPQILGYGRTYLMGNALVTVPRGAELAVRSRPWPSCLIILMLVTITFYVWFVNRGRQDPRRERPVTAPASPGPARRRGERRPAAAARVDRSGRLVEVWLRLHTALTYAFLFLPIIVVVVFSFNARPGRPIWAGFSVEWFGVALGDEVVQRRLTTASRSSARRTRSSRRPSGRWPRSGCSGSASGSGSAFDALTYISIIVPEIVIALSTLVLFATSFDASTTADRRPDPAGFPTIIAAHALFNISIVLLLVRARLSGMDRTHVEASSDLYATPWRTFRQITFPSCCRRSSPGSCCRSRSASTTS